MLAVRSLRVLSDVWFGVRRGLAVHRVYLGLELIQG